MAKDEDLLAGWQRLEEAARRKQESQKAGKQDTQKAIKAESNKAVKLESNKDRKQYQKATFSLEIGLLEALRDFAHHQRRTKTEVLEAALREYLGRHNIGTS